jgi:hypothetical protein
MMDEKIKIAHQVKLTTQWGYLSSTDEGMMDWTGPDRRLTSRKVSPFLHWIR